MCFVNYVENHSRKIINCWKEYTERVKIDGTFSQEHEIIGMNDILQASINKKDADRINKYYGDRYTKFN